MSDDPARLSGLIDKIISSLGLAHQYHGWRVVSQWPQIVGPDISAVARADRFKEGVLTVIVEKDVWRQELEMQLDLILEKIWSRPGGRAVQKIILRAGSIKEQN